MRKAIVLGITAVLALGAGTVFAQDCGELRLNFKLPSIDLIPGDDLHEMYVPMIAAHYGLEPGVFEWCWTQQVVGTISGTWVSCGGTTLSEGDPFGFGFGPDLYPNPGIIITKKGDLYSMSWGLSRYDATGAWLAFGGVTRYADGTGRFAGALGWGTDAPQHFPPSFWIRSSGYICLQE